MKTIHQALGVSDERLPDDNGPGWVRALTTLAMAGLALAGCASAPERVAGPASTGAAGGATAVGADAKLSTCERPVGSVRLQDGLRSADTNNSQTAANANIESVRLLLRDVGSLLGTKKEGPDVSGALESMRLLIQQSNCFVIVDRGLAEEAATDEKRRTSTSGEVRDDANMGRGQEVAADFVLRGTIVALEQGKKSGFNLGALLPGRLGSAVDTRSSVSDVRVQLVLSDIRSKIQVAAAQGAGSSTNTKIALGVLGLSRRGAGAGGFSSEESTSAQTIVLQAFADAYNQMVPAVRGYTTQAVRGGLGAGGTLGVQGSRSDPSAGQK
jgi:curli biogenesis system outer membrane secretion channel CsgG